MVTCESEREATDYKVRVLEIARMDKVTSGHQPLPSLHSLTLVYIKHELLICFRLAVSL